MKLYRKDVRFIYSKWFHHVGTMRAVVKKKSGEMILVFQDGIGGGEYDTITDSHALDVFIWLGRYLAKKGKLPRHLALDEIAVKIQRSSKDIRAVIATEHYQQSDRTAKGEGA